MGYCKWGKFGKKETNEADGLVATILSGQVGGAHHQGFLFNILSHRIDSPVPRKDIQDGFTSFVDDQSLISQIDSAFLWIKSPAPSKDLLDPKIDSPLPICFSPVIWKDFTATWTHLPCSRDRFHSFWYVCIIFVSVTRLDSPITPIDVASMPAYETLV